LFTIPLFVEVKKVSVKECDLVGLVYFFWGIKILPFFDKEFFFNLNFFSFNERLGRESSILVQRAQRTSGSSDG
jgi:hypothetical protein